jgi:hypothetical protein
MTFGPANSRSSYLPPEFQIEGDEEFVRLLIAQRERLTATILNIKENAQYEKQELLSGQQWFTSQTGGATGGARTTSYIYRLTFDLVALNGGAIANGGATTLTLSTTTQPAAINIPTAIQPVHGFGAANNATNFFFINDPLVFVRTNVWTNGSQQVIITNNSGATLTQAVWCFEYIKT